MLVTALTPRGFCHGVVQATKQLRDIAQDPTLPQPIQVLGMVVHNRKIVEDFTALGIITLDDRHKTRLELLEQVNQGTVVITAHGASDAVYRRIQEKGLTLIDTTCTDVTRAQVAVKQALSKGHTVLFAGRKNHPESETVLSYGDGVHLIETPEDVAALAQLEAPISMTNQTTMSLFDIYPLFEAVRKRYPTVELLDEQCEATRLRQLALMRQPKTVEHCFVVGDPRSNNSRKLVEVSIEAGIPATLIESVADLNPAQLKTYRHVSVTSGASTPTILTQEVIRYLKAFNQNSIDAIQSPKHTP
ncbi:MAG: 4-hydroxy-3-methylbut-2-enyl diphosphate reductase [Acholeplasmatales bacterium]|nr:MAG: 4-hydroxy-3-methylbut-2-enyl diphosphate reductase [Acholeplasmatales bacterium]